MSSSFSSPFSFEQHLIQVFLVWATTSASSMVSDNFILRVNSKF